MRVAYFAHDLNDPAVAKRVRMLEAGGATVSLAGFRRGRPRPGRTAQAVELGQTYDSDLKQRAFAILRHLVWPFAWARVSRGAHVILARNLEMLILASLAKVFAPRTRLVYESLDVHRTLLGQGFASRLLRTVEGGLLRRCDLLIVSSPAFLSHHFKRRYRLACPTLLVENRVLDLEADASRPARQAPPVHAGAWTVGWFGNIRCRRSLDMLTGIAAASEGRVTVVIRGRPAHTEFEDFDGHVRAARGVEYLGPYGPEDLAAHYAAVDFVWGLDFFEEGQNSAWLLPNRLYEGVAHGRTVIALSNVETGRWLANHDAGVLISDPERDLPAFFANLTEAQFKDLQARTLAIPTQAVVAGLRDCQALVEALGGEAGGA